MIKPKYDVPGSECEEVLYRTGTPLSELPAFIYYISTVKVGVSNKLKYAMDLAPADAYPTLFTDKTTNRDIWVIQEKRPTHNQYGEIAP